ncbi:large conductance mechanosensitive channel protein MscL [Candidatus Parcubacteria bacterium]|nr:large conductance mechanosensitive channel protein MscL [Candidatus Parcubacteria bacterium]
MMHEFKQFLLRGNVVDLAVGVVVGAAFGAVVTALVADFLTPLIAAVARVPDFSSLAFEVNGSKFMYGHFINALISFVLVALAVFLFVVKPMNALARKREALPDTRKCPECLSEIPAGAKRCAFCGQSIS